MSGVSTERRDFTYMWNLRWASGWLAFEGNRKGHWDSDGQGGYGVVSLEGDLSETKADCCVPREPQQPVWLERGEGIGRVVLNKTKVWSYSLEGWIECLLLIRTPLPSVTAFQSCGHHRLGRYEGNSAKDSRKQIIMGPLSVGMEISGTLLEKSLIKFIKNLRF